MKHNLSKKLVWMCLGVLLAANAANAATYVAVSTASGVDEYVVNGSSWTYDHQIIPYTGLYGVTYNPADGLLYACDAIQNQVFSIDPTNGTQTVLATLGNNTPGWTSSNPQNIAFGPDGKLYFCTAFGTPTSLGVFSMNKDGSGFAQFISQTGTGWSLGRARDLTWAGTNLYVTSRDNNNVYKFSSSGALVGTGPINSAAVTGASSLYADTNNNVLYVGCNQSGVNSIRSLNIGGTLPVAPGSATDSGGKVNSLGMINIGGVLFYITFSSGTSSHGAIYRLNADKTSTVAVADLGATANDFTVMGVASTGPLNSVSLQFPRTTMVAGTFQQATVLANFLLITNDVSADPGTTYRSDNTNVLAVAATGKVIAVNVGSANVVATYSGKSATNLVTVTPLVTTLIHRYGFTNDASDSVGTANGTMYGSDYSFTGGQLALQPPSQYDFNYADFGPNAISGNDAITFEAWASFGTNYTWARLFDFGDNDGFSGTSYVSLTPHSSAGTTRVAINSGAGETDVDAPGVLDNRTNVHIVVVFRPLAGYIKLYLNGILAAQNLNVSGQELTNVVNNYSFLGKSQFANDPAATLSVNEFRIYSGVLDATNAAIDFAGGPNQLVSNPGALQSISLTINSSMLEQGQQTAVAYGNFANVANVPLNNFAGVSFTSDNTNTLTVTAAGVVRAVGPGTAHITVAYGGQSDSASVTAAPLPQARFLVADAGNNRVLSFNAVGTNWTANGTFVSAASGAFAWGTNGNTAPLNYPWALAQNAAGNVYVAEGVNGGRVLKFAGNGTYLATVGTEGIDFTGIPDALTFGPDGNLYMSTAFGTNATAHVLEYNVTSSAWSEFVAQSAPPNGFTAPRGIAFDPAGNLYVCNRGSFGALNQMVQEFDANGVYVQDLAGGLAGPQALSYDAPNQRFIVSVGNTSLDAIGTNGAVTSIATGVGSLILDALSVEPNVFYSDYSQSGVYAVTSGSTSALVAGGMLHAGHMALNQLPPNLNSTLAGGNIVVSWPYSYSTYQLQATTSLNPTDWQNVLTAPVLNGHTMQVTLPAAGGTQFFRLTN